jgi:hypothetical protein
LIGYPVPFLMQKLPSMDKEQQPQSLGYVTTANDRDEEGVGFSYKLGTCASSSVYSLVGSERGAALLLARRMMGMEDAMVAGSGLLTET